MEGQSIVDGIRKEVVELEGKGIYVYKYNPSDQTFKHAIYLETNQDDFTSEAIGILLKERRITVHQAIEVLNSTIIKKTKNEDERGCYVKEEVEVSEEDYVPTIEIPSKNDRLNLEKIAVLTPILSATTDGSFARKIKEKIEYLVDQIK